MSEFHPMSRFTDTCPFFLISVRVIFPKQVWSCYLWHLFLSLKLWSPPVIANRLNFMLLIWFIRPSWHITQSLIQHLLTFYTFHIMLHLCSSFFTFSNIGLCFTPLSLLVLFFPESRTFRILFVIFIPSPFYFLNFCLLFTKFLNFWPNFWPCSM